MSMNCDIFIRSYWKDFPWLELCLASIARFCRGFRSVVVVIPRSSEAWLRRRPGLIEGADTRLELCRDYEDDYLGQQATKLLADTLTDADFICHVDSDCIFTTATAPEHLIVDGKARIVTRPVESLGRHWPWRKPTEAFLGWSISHCYMSEPPFTFPRWIYGELRRHAEITHAMALERYVATRPARGFSEFNALGAFAHARHGARFAWIDGSQQDPDTARCRWYWSWQGLDKSTRREIDAMLVPPI